ncbi:TetR-family transcriptional regulator [Streptomyces sp. L-9-10]|uniref:TetR-like C-terminal domain-containing protein n=1 Tax=Streptomyces sp. L-9-10 TaxID=1478131 RepID=UPI0010E91F58|nr:TetR-like C-terminal domain-containing protein [Streptomyces sp. L-9-10]RYJ25795.1 TetR-family transcriptional regulator [Streptomyces sp. L-9-10]
MPGVGQQVDLGIAAPFEYQGVLLRDMDVARSMSAAADGQALAESREEFWKSRSDLARIMIDRAVTRGELPEGTDPAFILEILIAPLHFRALLTRRPNSHHLNGRLVDLLLDGLTH